METEELKKAMFNIKGKTIQDINHESYEENDNDCLDAFTVTFTDGSSLCIEFDEATITYEPNKEIKSDKMESDIHTRFEPKTYGDLLYILGKHVRLGRIDKYGFNGRELHPDSRTDNNITVQIVGLDNVEDYHSHHLPTGTINKMWEYVRTKDKLLPEEWIACFIARKHDGSFIEVMDSEIHYVLS